MPPGYAVKALAEVPAVPGERPGDPDWRPLQHHFRINAFGLNVFTAPSAGTVPVSVHDERQSGQQELYLVLEGEIEFEFNGTKQVLGPGGVARVDPATVRRMRNTSPDAEAMYFCVGGDGGYVGRDGQTVD